MDALEIEKQRELLILNNAIASLREKVELAMQDDGANKTEVFASGVTKYIELKFNKVLLDEGLDTELDEHMFIPLAVLNWYITQEGEEIAKLYMKYDLKVLSLDELTAEIEKHANNIIDARLGMLRLGKLDA